MEKKQMNFMWALVPIIVMIAAMGVAVIKLEQDPHVPLIIGTATAALVAYRFGAKWHDIEQWMYKGITMALPAVVIIMLVGLTIGAWVGGGIIASMIYYGLQILNPTFFLVTIVLICGIVALMTGTSWGTMGTVGIAAMGIGMSMGIPAAMVAGAVISGSYFGDKMSPLSDTTNLAAGLTGTDLFEHIKNMLYTTIPGLIITLITFGILGFKFKTDKIQSNEIDGILTTLNEQFVISPWLLLIPLLVIILVAKKVPAIPALLIGVILGFIAQITVQGGSLLDAVNVLHNGYSMDSGNAMVDELFDERGGLFSMMYTVSMTIVAMTFGGILEFSGILQVLVGKLLKYVKSVGGLITSTIATAFATNATCSEQYISIVVPSRMFVKAYEDKGLHSKNLSRALEDGGTLTSVFVPWNTCGVFIFGVLGVSAFEYAPYAILNFVVPIISIIFAYTGFTIAKLSKEEVAAIQAQREEV